MGNETILRAIGLNREAARDLIPAVFLLLTIRPSDFPEIANGSGGCPVRNTALEMKPRVDVPGKENLMYARRKKGRKGGRHSKR